MACSSAPRNVALAPTGLRVRQYSVLAAGLRDARTASRSGTSPARWASTRSQVVSLVDELAGSGLVERHPSESDRRTKLVAGTAAGRAVRDEAVGRVEAAIAGQLAGLSGTERLILRDLLTRLVTGSAGTL